VHVFLPTLLQHIQFGAKPGGVSVAAGIDWLRTHETQPKSETPAPQDVITWSWQRHALHDDGSVDPRAYTFCVLDA